MLKVHVKGVIVSNDIQWIYDLFDIESTSPNDVYQVLDSATNEDLEVVINSGGGDVFAGSEIYTILKDYKGKVTSKIVGIAASAASVIAMAGQKVMISPTAQMMIHNVSSMAAGDYRDLQHESDVLKNFNKTIANAYILKSGMDQAELLDLMDKETWFNAQQAKEKGLVDEIMFDDSSQPKLVASATGTQLIPQQVIDTIRNKVNKDNPNKADLKGLLPEGFVTNQIETPIQNEEEDEVMDLEKLKNEHPDLYNQVKKAGYEEGVKAENSRIKAIEDLGIPGSEDLVNKAKFETGESAEKLAVNILKNQKEQGAQYLNNSKDDATDLEDVDGAEAPENNNNEDQEIKDTASKMANIINKKRGGTK